MLTQMTLFSLGRGMTESNDSCFSQLCKRARHCSWRGVSGGVCVGGGDDNIHLGGERGEDAVREEVRAGMGTEGICGRKPPSRVE